MKKNGFTFIEMLGVITLLVIISVIVLVVVDKSLKDSKGILYSTQIENIKSSARMWMADNIELILDDGYYTITLGDLQSSGYISNEIKTLIDDEVYDSNLIIRIGMDDVILYEDVDFGSYVLLDYIESDGNQYINLDYAVKKVTELRLDIEFIENENTYSASANNSFIGRNAVIGEHTFSSNFGGKEDQNKRIYFWLNKTYASGATPYYQNYDSVLNRSMMILKSGSAKFQGIETFFVEKENDNVATLVLLGSCATDSDLIEEFNRYNAKIYGFQIYENGNLIKDMVPIYSKIEGIAGLYDLVNNVFYDSDGTNDFIYNME